MLFRRRNAQDVVTLSTTLGLAASAILAGCSDQEPRSPNDRRSVASPEDRESTNTAAADEEATDVMTSVGRPPKFADKDSSREAIEHRDRNAGLPKHIEMFCHHGRAIYVLDANGFQRSGAAMQVIDGAEDCAASRNIEQDR